MAKYKIKVFKHLLKNNKIAKQGDIVDGVKFVNLEDSLKGGFVEKVDELKGMNKQELIDYAKANSIEVDETAKKAEILEAIKK